MSFQDLQCLVWDGDARCSECGELMDGENTSIEAFEARGELLCADCYECECADAWGDEDDDG